MCLNKETLKKLIEGKHKSHFRKGMILAWQGTTPPPGWKLCDGENGTPDLRGRFVLGSGQGTGLISRSVGSKGGSEENKLEGGHIPVHRHYLTHDKWGMGGFGVATDTTKTRFHDGKLVSNNGKMFLSQTCAYHDANSATRNNPNFEYILHGAKSDKNQYEPTAGLTGKPVNQFGDKMGVGTKSVNNMPPYYVLAYIMKMNDELQASEIKTKAQYQTEIQDLQAKILKLENMFKNDVIMNKNLEVKGKIKLGDFNLSSVKNTSSCNNCLYIKKDGVPVGFQIGQYDNTEKVDEYEKNGNGLFLSPTKDNHGGLGTPKQRFDDIAIETWKKWDY